MLSPFFGDRCLGIRVDDWQPLSASPEPRFTTPAVTKTPLTVQFTLAGCPR